jgi:hypothetical protein
MMDIPLIDELREARRRLSEQQEDDPRRYAAMLQQTSQNLPGSYVTDPLPAEETTHPPQSSPS